MESEVLSQGLLGNQEGLNRGGSVGEAVKGS